jgi:transcriptional regulator with XRE-family HTH domain
VREKRKEKGLTQKRLGEMFDLSQTYVGWLELGKARRLDEGKIKDILTLLEIDFRDFLIAEEPEAVSEQSPARETPRETPQETPQETRQKSALVSPVKNEVSGEKGEHGLLQSVKEYKPGGKERKRFLEWVRDKARIGIRLNNGEILEGYIKWWDIYTLKFVTGDKELVIPKHSILYYIDAPKRR